MDRITIKAEQLGVTTTLHLAPGTGRPGRPLPCTGGSQWGSRCAAGDALRENHGGEKPAPDDH